MYFRKFNSCFHFFKLKGHLPMELQAMSNMIHSPHLLAFRLYQNLLNDKLTFFSSIISSSFHESLLTPPPVLEFLGWYSDAIKGSYSMALVLHHKSWVNIVFSVYLLLLLNLGIFKITFWGRKKQQKHLHRYYPSGKFCTVLM